MSLYDTMKIAEVWAGVDGCEGGDFIMSLVHTASMSHYSNAGEDKAAEMLQELLQREIDFMVDIAYGPNPEEYGIEPECIKDAEAQIDKILTRSRLKKERA